MTALPLLKAMDAGATVDDFIETHARKPPFLVIGPAENPDMVRWALTDEGPDGVLYLHHIRRPDPSDDSHDHTADAVTLVLRGWYKERVGGRRDDPVALRDRGAFVPRRAEDLHTITDVGVGGAWTLFRRLARRREWGFVCPDGRWVAQAEYLAGSILGRGGKGCGG